MTWTVYSNPVADMVGPWFLAFYLLYCVGLMWLVSRARRRYLGSYSPFGSNSVALPAKVDPYYVAWLKGGIDHVLKLVMMRLSYKGLLTAGKNKGKTFIRPQGDSPEQLNRLERLVLSCFASGEGQKKGRAFSALRPLYQEFNAQAQRDGYTYPANYQRASLGILWVGLVCMLGMGGYKLTIATLKGHHNIWFLIAMMLFFGWIYYAIFLRNRAGKANVTAKGEKFLSRLSASLPKDKKSLKQLDIAMVAIALADNREIYSRCALGRQAYKLGLIYPLSAAAVASGYSSMSSHDSSSSSSDSSSSDSSSSSGCSGCGGCGGD